MLPQPLTPADRAIYEWQMWIDDFGEKGQERLKGATVLVSRIGGVGGALAMQLAMAGVGKLILAHAGTLKPSDLNRQLLMSHQGLDTSRVEQAAQRLRTFNPQLQIETLPENISPENFLHASSGADAIASCAPLFSERLLMNQAAVHRKIPMVDCAMFDTEIQITTIVPLETPCLQCLYPTPPPSWKRQFPVLGAVAGAAGSLGAMEIIKALAGFGDPLKNRLLIGDLRTMNFRKIQTQKAPHCLTCGNK